MPGLDGPELEALYARGKGWLVGKDTLSLQLQMHQA